MQNVTIVVPNYNGKMLLERQLPLLTKIQENPTNKIKEIIVVDDASKDESVNFIKKNYPNIRLIKHRINRGFSSTVNTGVRMAKGDLIALLNSDVLPETNFLKPVLEHFEQKEIFAVSLHEKGYGFAKGVFRNGFIEHEPGGEPKMAMETFWVSGGSGVWRRDIWISLGGMDEKLLSPFYWEDLDLSYRAQKRGYKLLWEPRSIVEHEHESTIKTLKPSYVAKIRERNQLLFVWKNLTSRRLFGKHIGGLLNRIIFHPGYLIVLFMALRKIALVLKVRRIEIKESRVSDEAIFQKFLRR